jgi:hypothetical protein
MRKSKHLWIAGFTLVTLTGALVCVYRFKVASPQAQPSSKNERTARPASHSAPSDADGPSRSADAREAVSGDGKPAWPLPRLAGPEVETRKAELLTACDAALQIADVGQRNAALSRVCYQWAEFDPLGAIEHALAWQLEEVPGLFENLALQWASADLPAARAWTETQPPSEFRSELVMRIGFALAQNDPEAAAHYVVRETEPGPSQTEAAITVLHQWLQKDPDAASAWANGFPAGALRERALQEVAGARQYQSGNLPVSDR